MSVYALMNAVPDMWLEYGGHHQSGGFSVADERIHDVSVRLCDACEALPAEDLLPPPQQIDAVLSLSQINDDLFSQLKKLAPFGMGNQKPLFLFSDVRIARVGVFGKAKDHTKLTIEGDDRQYEAIAFFMLPEQFSVTPEIGAVVQLIGYLEESYFLGRRERRIRVVDVRSVL
jgi:single-stranded-DNA-specific exonuclease